MKSPVMAWGMTKPTLELLHGWGRHPVVEAPTLHSASLERDAPGAVLSRGLARSYGDAALPPPGARRPVLVTPAADRILAFDESTGVLRAEAGLSLGELARVFLPRRWFSPVSTGTQYVTLGGMVASDVHGKNHHSFGTITKAIRSLRIAVADGRIVATSPAEHPDLFYATLGGMGLTGHILEVELQLTRIPSPWIYEESWQAPNLEGLFQGLADSSDWPMTAAWVDTSTKGSDFGRGLVIRGRWAEPDEAPAHPPGRRPSIEVPPVFPSGVMNPLTIQLLSTVWFHRHGAKKKQHVTHPANHFWQLDMATNWFRGYGQRGFTQYQCVLPRDVDVHRAFVRLFQKLGGCSFINVYKDCGEAGPGLLSFPQYGTSIALDIPITTVDRTQRLVDGLNDFVVDHGGRVYLAKDAFTRPSHFARMYPRIEEFNAVRDRWDPERRLSSWQSVRLLGDPLPGELDGERQLQSVSAR
ncbi:MAG: FAD-binding oxidoreductase [Myxococcota bacterium]